MFQKRFSRSKRERNFFVCVSYLSKSCVVNDKPPTDGVIDLAHQYFFICTIGGKAHTICVFRKPFIIVEQNMLSFAERDRLFFAQEERACFLNVFDFSGDGIRIYAICMLSL